jgi:DNA-binding response OmpR family regulator
VVNEAGERSLDLSQNGKKSGSWKRPRSLFRYEKIHADFCEVNRYEVEFAFNGVQGLERLIGTPYGLAIVDFLVREMHAVDFVRRAKGTCQDLSVIAMSAFGDVENAFLEAWADLFLKKPFDPYRLEKEIELIAAKGTRENQAGGFSL